MERAVYSFPKAAITKYHKLGGLKQPCFFPGLKCILSWCWRLEVQNQGVVKALLSLMSLGVDPSRPLPASGGPRHSSVCGCITLVSVSIFTWPSSLCLCLFSFFLFLKIYLINLFIYFGCVGSSLLRVGFSLVAASGGYFSLQ